MAIISSYPVSTPQLGDKILGSNIIDASGTPVIGNPTVQFTITSIKTLVDQSFASEHTAPYFTSSAITITPLTGANGSSIKFGANNAGSDISNVNYTAATNTFTFKKIGTYYIQLFFNTRGNGNTSPKFAFITKENDIQIGPTTLNKTTRGVTGDRQLVTIDIMLNITDITKTYQFWAAQQDINSGALVVDTFDTGWTSVPSAGITISKLT